MTSEPGQTSAQTPQAEPARGSLARSFGWMKVKERIIAVLLFLCALVSVMTTLGIIYVLVSQACFGTDGEAFFQRVSVTEFLTGTEWSPTSGRFGVLPLVCGTLLIAMIAGLVSLPVGLASAIYLSEYASARTRKIVKPILEILAGIPTVVYGYLALVLITPYVLQPIFTGVFGLEVNTTNALSAGIVVGIMIIPMVSSLSEDALRAVPQSLREAGYALGSTKFDVSIRVVVPSAFSGIVASFILALSRAVGETMAVTLAAGLTAQITGNPLQSVATMTATIVDTASGDLAEGSIEYKSLYAVGLALFLLTLTLNLLSQFIMRRYREVYQ